MRWPNDMRAQADVAGWLIAEFNTMVDRLPQSFDRAAAKAAARCDPCARGRSRAADERARDLFLIYVPEDRLPVAAPLAVELTKRRMSVAFAGYEVATAHRSSRRRLRTASPFIAAVQCCGPQPSTVRGWALPTATDRLRILRDARL